jgi:nucleoside-diphosphate-sugar epimerase
MLEFAGRCLRKKLGGTSRSLGHTTMDKDIATREFFLGIDRISDVEQLENLLSLPTPEVVQLLDRLDGDILLLGAGGKIGPSLAHMIRRASDLAGKRRRVLAVLRRSQPELEKNFARWGIEVRLCDMLDPQQLTELPEAPYIFYLAAMKFGTTGQEPMTWAINTFLPGLICQRFRHSRIVAYSTGNVYPLVPPTAGGSKESDPPGPIGQYAMSCLGREQIFSYFSMQYQMPVALLRLNYANEMRYGTLVDLAQVVLSERPVDLSMAYFNAIWQGDANAMAIRALQHVDVPPRILNIAGPKTLSVREVAGTFAELFGKPLRFGSTEGPDALLNDARASYKLLGEPLVPEEKLMQWIADWLLRGGPTLRKPTMFQVRNGKF